MIPGVLIGTFGGALIAGYLDKLWLGILFALIVCFSATQLLLDLKPKATRALPSIGGLSLAGAIIGALASLAALAGASLTVPFLVSRNVKVHEAIGTAAAIGWPLAFAGTAGYVVSGWSASKLPEHSVGFVYLPAALWIVITSVALAPVGAWVAHQTQGKVLRRVFAIVMYVLALKMVWSLVQ
jgi:uncharacterized membrane protein YfcA